MDSAVSGKYIVYKNGKLVGATNNMILDSYFDRFWGSLTGWGGHMWVGSGSTAVAPTDTGLETVIAGSHKYIGNATVSHYVHGGDYFSDRNWIMTWAVGELVGNVTEVGLRMQNGATEPVDGFTDSRALIRDVNGDPTTIVMTSADELTISYFFTQMMPGQRQSIEVNIGGTIHKMTHGITNCQGGTYGWGGERSLYYSGAVQTDNAWMAAISGQRSFAQTFGVLPSSRTTGDFAAANSFLRSDIITGSGEDTIMTRTFSWTLLAADLITGILSLGWARNNGGADDWMSQVFTFDPKITDSVGRTVTVVIKTRMRRGMEASGGLVSALSAHSLSVGVTEIDIPVGAHTSRGTVTAVPSGGKAPYTYSWALEGSAGTPALTADTPSLATTTFNATGVSLDNSVETWRCTITDDDGLTATVDTTVDLTWEA